MTITKTLIPAGNPAAPGDYSLMSTAEANDQQVLAEPYVLDCYAGTIDDSALWDGWTCTETNNVTIKAADGEGHGGVEGAGFIMISTGIQSALSLFTGMDYAVVKGWTSYSNSTLQGQHGVNISVQNVTVEDMFLRSGTGNFSGGLNTNQLNTTARNCLARGGVRGFMQNGAGGGTLENCVAIDVSDRGFHQTATVPADQTSYANCVSYGAGLADFGTIAASTGNTNNASGDATAAGALPQINIPAGAFVDYAGGDYSPAASGALDGTGADLSGSFATDIAGDTRTVPWTIGAYIVASAGATITFDGPNVVSVAGTDGTPLPDPTPDPSMDSRFTPVGGTATYALQSGTLPAGVTIDPATGNLVGTPTESGTFPDIIVRGTVS